MPDLETSGTSFASLGLTEPLQQGVAGAGFVACTSIQAQAMPLALAGRDVAGQAQTGTGKTAAFLLATFNHLSMHRADSRRKAVQPRALILAPTRELAVQIHRDAGVLGKYLDLKLGLVYGGTGYESQRKQLQQGVDILIGTPGRLIDYFKQRIFDLKAVQVVVLDEADRMFDLGFIKDIRYLLRRMPPPTRRLGMLFSATLSYRVMELAYEHMNNPEFIRITPDKKTVDEVQQTVYHPANSEKVSLLVGLLRQMDPVRSLVFTNTREMAERLSVWLRANGCNAAALTGDVPQRQRLRLLQQFTEGKLPVLVATDVAARGLHIPDVSHVFNYDLPQDPEDYVHRVGRTARAGSSGDAISFACEGHAYSLIDIEAFLGHKLPNSRITPALLADVRLPPKAARSGGRHGARRGNATKTKRAGDRAPRARGETAGPRSRRRDNAGRARRAHKPTVG
ncbi:MAG: DEAD/DEAH box helicase [Acidiferrobacterales bacterium]